MGTHFDREDKTESHPWKPSASPTPKKRKMEKSVGKLIAASFWDAGGVPLVGLPEQGRPIASDYCASCLEQRRAAIITKRRDTTSKGVHLNYPGQHTGTQEPSGKKTAAASRCLRIYLIFRIWCHVT